MGAADYDLELDENQPYRRRLRPLDGDGVLVPLAGVQVAAQIRQKERTTARLVLDLGPYLAVGPDGIDLDLPTSAVAQIIAARPTSSTSWDLFLWPTGQAGEAICVMEGLVAVEYAVTQLPAE